MKKQNSKFVLASATLAEVNTQLKLNMFATVAVVFVLIMNIMKFMADKTALYAVLTMVMIVLLFFIRKTRGILMLRKEELTQ